MKKYIDEYVEKCEKVYAKAHLEYATGNSPIKDSMNNLVSAMAIMSVAEDIKKVLDVDEVLDELQDCIIDTWNDMLEGETMKSLIRPEYEKDPDNPFILRKVIDNDNRW